MSLSSRQKHGRLMNHKHWENNHAEYDRLAKMISDHKINKQYSPVDTAMAEFQGKTFLQSRIGEVVFDALTQIKEREAVVIIAHSGLDGSKKKTLREVGEIIGVSVERCRQLEERGRLRLRRVANSMVGREMSLWLGCNFFSCKNGTRMGCNGCAARERACQETVREDRARDEEAQRAARAAEGPESTGS